jgi:hypothetical protein
MLHLAEAGKENYLLQMAGKNLVELHFTHFVD